jgi:hypothetical protein
MRNLGNLQVKTGLMIDTRFVHDKDDALCFDACMKLPRAREYGISGASGFYLLFEYDDLAEANELFESDCEAACRAVDVYEERYHSYEAHPDIDGASPCCGGYGEGGKEFNDLGWNIDMRVYQCVECEEVVDI